MKRKKLFLLFASTCLILALAVSPFMAACAAPVEPGVVDVSALQKEIASLEKEVAAAEKGKAASEKEVATLEKEIAAAEKEIAKLEAAAPTPTPTAEAITWKLQQNGPAGSTQSPFVKHLAEKITTMSNGRLIVEAYPGGAVYPATEELYGVDAGVLEMGISNPTYSMDKFPQASLFSYVSGGLTPLQRFMWYQKGGGDELAARLWEPSLNVKYIGLGILYTPEVWCHSSKELNSPEDIRGLKFRCSGEGGEILARMGAATVYVPGGELYEAMQRGVIDAFEYSSLKTNWDNGFSEVADYMYLSPSRAPSDTCHAWVNRDAWEKLTPDLQMIVEEAVRGTAIEHYMYIVFEGDVALHQFIDYGVEVQPLPESIADAFSEVANLLYEEKGAGDPFYSEIIESQWVTKEMCEAQDIR